MSTQMVDFFGFNPILEMKLCKSYLWAIFSDETHCRGPFLDRIYNITFFTLILGFLFLISAVLVKYKVSWKKVVLGTLLFCVTIYALLVIIRFVPPPPLFRKLHYFTGPTSTEIVEGLGPWSCGILVNSSEKKQITNYLYSINVSGDAVCAQGEYSIACINNKCAFIK
jgi:hypothetical protein